MDNLHVIILVGATIFCHHFMNVVFQSCRNKLKLCSMRKSYTRPPPHLDHAGIRARQLSSHTELSSLSARTPLLNGYSNRPEMSVEKAGIEPASFDTSVTLIVT